MVVVPLAYGAHNARNQSTTVANVTDQTTRSQDQSVPGPEPMASVPPSVRTEVLPRSETRDDQSEDVPSRPITDPDETDGTVGTDRTVEPDWVTEPDDPDGI